MTASPAKYISKARASIAALSVACSLSGCHATFGSVTRVVDGVATEGRVITSEAYAAYARGADFEMRGNLEQALVSYRAALAEDESPEIWTRIGALECRIAKGRGRSREGAQEAFENALDLDAEYAPAWYELALCEKAWGSYEQALNTALKAVRFDPERVETSLLVIELLEQLRRVPEANRWFDALVTRHHNSLQVQRARLEYAERHRDTGRALRARMALAELAALEPLRPRCLATNLSQMDEALTLGDTRSARALAVGCQIGSGELAARAAALGLIEVARTESALVLGANPNATNAWVAALVASDLARDDADFTRLSGMLGDTPEKPSSLAVRLMIELLTRRFGADTADAWRKSYEPLPQPKDELERAVAERMR